MINYLPGLPPWIDNTSDIYEELPCENSECDDER